VTYNFQTGDGKVKLLTEYESVIQEVLFGSAVLPRVDIWEKI
jgi:hypothetical protein